MKVNRWLNVVLGSTLSGALSLFVIAVSKIATKSLSASSCSSPNWAKCAAGDGCSRASVSFLDASTALPFVDVSGILTCCVLFF
jgi:hypothetical protein